MNTQRYLNDLTTQISNTLEQYNDTAILDINVTSRLVSKYYINIPELDFDKMKIMVNQERINTHNMPDNIPFVPGAMIDVVDYRIPINGDLSIINSIIAGSHILQKDFCQGAGDLIHKHYEYGGRINNSEEKMQLIKEVVKFKINQFQQVLQSFAEEAEKFNAELPTLVSSLVESKREKINTKKSIENQLNPFK